MVSDEIMLKVENVSKIYKLGEIGGTTVRDELQRVWAKIRKKDDPTKKIGSKKYNKGEKFKALDNVSFEVKKGERIGIIGHNGAGKSTLLKLISRVTGPSGGKIYMNGRVASMLEVGTGFHPELTGRENIYMNGAILGMTKKEIDTKMEDIIEFSEVRQFIDTPVKRYSSGMYVKLAFSVAAHLDSEILIMDEVLAVGDVQFQNKCLKKMKEVSEQEDRTILYVSHNMNTIRELCDKVIVLNQGSIVFVGAVEDGIEKYMGINLDKRRINVFEKKQSYSHITNLIDIKKLVLLNSSNDLVFNSSLKFSLEFESKAKINDLIFRFIFRTFDKTPIATSFSEALCVDIAKKIESSYEVSLSHIAPGDYCMAIAAMEIDNKGNMIFHDTVPIALSFSIYTLNKQVYNIEWNKSSLGNNSLNQAKIIK